MTQAFRVFICDVKPFDDDLEWTTRVSACSVSSKYYPVIYK